MMVYYALTFIDGRPYFWTKTGWKYEIRTAKYWLSKQEAMQELELQELESFGMQEWNVCYTGVPMETMHLWKMNYGNGNNDASKNKLTDCIYFDRLS